MSPEEQKLNKPKAILEIVDRDFITVNEIVPFLETMIDLIGKVSPNAVSASLRAIEPEIARVQRLVADLKEGTGRDFDAGMSQIRADFDALRKALQEEIAAIPQGEKGDTFTFDDLTEEQKEELKGLDGSPDTPEQIRNKLETLTGDERLDKSAIKGLENIEKLSDDVQRWQGYGGTNALRVQSSGSPVSDAGIKTLNFTGATVSYNGEGKATVAVTGGSGAVDSVNGQTGVVVLDADDISDTTTTNKFTTAAEKTKLGHISVTQAVDLDALETASHDAVTLAGEDFLSLSGQQITANPIDLDNLSATGTPSSSTFLRGDNTWATPAGSGDVSKVGTPVDNQIGVWTGDGTLEGDTALTFDTATDHLSTGTSGKLTTGSIELGAASDTTISRVSAGQIAVENVNVLMNGGALGTPSSGTLTNCSGLPLSGVVDSTSEALGVGTLEVGHASDTTISRSAAGVIAVEGTAIPKGTGTSNEIAYWSGTNTVASLATATYPSLTELSYVKGVTSAIQTQIDALTGAVVLKGTWDASAGTFPGGGSAQAGFSYIVSVSGTVDGVAFTQNDRIVAITNNASTTVYSGNWFKLDYTDQVLSVAGKTGAVTLDKSDVGLGNVDNTSDLNKPISTATQNALNTKLENITGLITASTNINITGTGTTADPYVISATGPAFDGGVAIDATPNTDDTVNGTKTDTFNAGATIAQWEAVYLDSTPDWNLTDADAAATAGSPVIALAMEAGTAGNPLEVLLWGFARNDAWNWTVGAPLYLSTTPGALTQTAPSATDDVVRVVGYAVTADTIFWNPSPDWITIV